ncbi:Pimeloyl-ACP methyl ester carboxylesterase [Devosia lucknowensis]|uniref:Pimeloyl-ACP methyl ester carboxylesterase n=1 Tax=Devosia lucknowensis TaxID=1096929 RepID=A0A1Y6F5W7_9HYPH|nr:alpha/beta hydrolase [Devosia lucknowensis]SMQ70177.1 Pimeloyl-ACP methyl ester carboxylesterase [Devosia lucknowensis]
MATQSIGLHTEDTGGSGRAVILIHGWPLSGKAWEHQVQALAGAGFRVITYDRRGFGQSDKPESGFDYSTLANDVADIIEAKALTDVSLVGFSMGGGEVARYVAEHGESKLHSVVFAAAVPPYMMKTPDNPDGPLTKEKADEMEAGIKADRTAFFDQFTKDFFSANGVLKVSEDERQKAIALCHQSDQTAALGCMASFGTTDFRDDLKAITVPTLVIHGDADGIVPVEGSGARTHAAIPGSEMVVVLGAPHGFNVSHAEEFNRHLIAFLRK